MLGKQHKRTNATSRRYYCQYVYALPYGKGGEAEACSKDTLVHHTNQV